MTPTPDKIAELGKLIAAQIPTLIDEARDQINEAINAAMEDSQERDDGKAILSLNISAKWDLNGSAVVVSMPVNVRRKFEVAANLCDPNQPELPVGE
jgi:tRNA G37 N-methylase Trm5